MSEHFHVKGGATSMKEKVEQLNDFYGSLLSEFHNDLEVLLPLTQHNVEKKSNRTSHQRQQQIDVGLCMR